jgi:hypothetical protein
MSIFTNFYQAKGRIFFHSKHTQGGILILLCYVIHENGFSPSYTPNLLTCLYKHLLC